MYTNANGYYIDTLSCSSGNIVKVRISVPNCNGAMLVENPQVNTATNIVERNFVLGCSPQQTCTANFSFVVQQGIASFNSTSTTSSSNQITAWHWTFGDGTSGTGVNIQHSYAVAGSYTVKLRIETANGCKDSITKVVTVINISGTCQAQFRDSMVAPNKYIFTSAGSTTVSGNAITQRFWSFGDGTFNNGNNIAVDHIYQQAGTYIVCLKIISANGCADSVCRTITITPAPPPCNANFNFQTSSTGTVNFINTSTTSNPGTVQYYWSFGNGVTISQQNATYTYTTPGTYNVCLRMFTSGCMDSICKTVVIAPPPVVTKCEAVYSFVGLPPTSTLGGYTLQFNSGSSHATSAAGDSIRERIWIWGDGTTTGGNLINATHTYTTPGTYNICLVIRSKSNCSDTTCKTVSVPMQNQLVCNARFTYENLPYTTPPNRPIKFNASTSNTVSGDSIISYKWHFGTGSTVTTTNPIVTFSYQQPGTYNVCLTIRTALGCERTECKVIVVTQSTSTCVPHFTWVKTGSKQISFNSSMSWVAVNDTIISRTWNFGNATPLLTGNVVSPVHNYLNNGVYTVALRIKTVKKCEQTVYIPVNVQDSIVNPANVEPIKIISIYPTPAQAQTQGVVWSKNNNVQAELAIYDVYGQKKWSMTKYLMQGNNVTVLPTAFLLPGPYYFRVTTVYGIKSKAFFKN